MEKRVLVTGASGFAGRYLSSSLSRRGYLVGGTASEHSKNIDGELHEKFVVDIRNFDQINEAVVSFRPTHVVHLAAISFVGHENVKEIYETNVVGTRNLLQALARSPEAPRSVLLVSSANVYGNSTREILDESCEINPVNDYAVSKIAMELMSRQFLGSLNIRIARPFNYTGRGQGSSFLVPKIVNHFKSRAQTIELGNLDIARDFSDVRTVVDYMALLLELEGENGAVFNICSGVPCSLMEIVKLCENISGHSMNVLVNPQFLRPNEVKILVGEPAKLANLVKNVKIYPIEQTLRWMLEL